MAPNSQINRTGFSHETGFSPRSAAMTANDPNNAHYRGVEWRAQRNPDYQVYVYNLSSRTFEDPANPGRGIIGRINLFAQGVQDEDPTAVLVEKSVGGKKEFAEEDGDVRYHYVTSFPQPVLISKFNDESETIGYIETDAVRFVVDQIHPDNPGRSLNAVLPNAPGRSQGNNFGEKGVFFSLTNPPLKQDVDEARARMEKYYTALLDKAAALEHSDEKQLGEELRGNPDYGYAAAYYGRTFKWNRKNVRTTECSNCGEAKPANRLFHTASWGLCVERTQEAWKAVVEAGVRTYDAVPDEFRWRAEKKAKAAE